MVSYHTNVCCFCLVLIVIVLVFCDSQMILCQFVCLLVNSRGIEILNRVETSELSLSQIIVVVSILGHG